MKKSLKKYRDFITESSSEFDEVKKILFERTRFFEEVHELSELQFTSRRSYSDLCKTNNDPEIDFNKMQSYMDSRGFSIEKIKLLFSDENNQKCGFNLIDLYDGNKTTINARPEFQEVRQWIVDSRTSLLRGLDSESASVDVYLYKLFEKIGLDKNLVELGGPGWADWSNGGDEEALIRYRYGYHQTKYGQLMLQQVGKTAEDLKSDAIKELKKELNDEFNKIIERVIKNKIDKKFPVSFDHNDFTLMEEDRLIIFCKEIADTLNRSNILNLYETKKFDSEDISSEFVKSLDWFKLSDDDEQSMEIVDGDLVIWGDFGT